MREIKFRAWGIKRKSMMKCDGSNFQWIGETALKKNSGYEIMQFTGLKDKNGKEIYEGDILYDRGVKSIVIWKNDGWGINNGKYNLNNYLDEGWEIIGNIYENPELLEEIK